MARIHLKRAYDEPSDEDGTRILVDRLWPRGVSKAKARIDLWCKALAPGDALRRWYGHDPKRFAEFARRYRRELAEAGDEVAKLRSSIDRRRRITLVTATKALELSHARILREHLARKL